MIGEFTILGERCSGTHYLQAIIEKNFDLNFTQRFGHKHFYIYRNSFENSDDCLFISIIRDPFDWINSLYLKPWHLSYETACNKHNFLNHLFYSKWPSPDRVGTKLVDLNVNIYDNRKKLCSGLEIQEDFNFRTNKKYSNIFECRYVKLDFMMNDMPTKVKHHYFVKYEDLKNKTDEVLFDIKNTFRIPTKHIQMKDVSSYKGGSDKEYVSTKYTEFARIDIESNKGFQSELECQLGYIE